MREKLPKWQLLSSLSIVLPQLIKALTTSLRDQKSFGQQVDDGIEKISHVLTLGRDKQHNVSSCCCSGFMTMALARLGQESVFSQNCFPLYVYVFLSSCRLEKPLDINI